MIDYQDMTTLERVADQRFTRKEKQNLKKITKKITKVPHFIRIPAEYFGKKREENEK